MRQPAQALPLLERVAQRAPDVERRLARRDRLLALIAQVAGDRSSLEQAGALGSGQRIAEPQGSGVLGRGFAVRVQGGGLLGGGDRELQHRRPVSRCLGVVCQPRQVTLRPGRFAQRGENAGMEEPAAQRRDGRQDGFASQFMAEGHPIASSPQQAPVDHSSASSRTGPATVSMRSGVDRRADHGGDIQDRPRLGREPSGPGQDGIADRGRHGLALGGEGLGQKERVAPGEPVRARRPGRYPLPSMHRGFRNGRTPMRWTAAPSPDHPEPDGGGDRPRSRRHGR